MEALDFLTAVLPSEGQYCTFTMTDKSRRNVFVGDLEQLYSTNLALSTKGQNTFYALSAFDNAESREASHAVAIKALFADMDCGEGKSFPSKRDAVQRLASFLQETALDKLGAPWLVDSGGGVHVYWPLREAVSIPEWKPVAEALKNAARSLNLPIDMTVTADAARVLRMPGTNNYKYTPPKPVTLRTRGGLFDLQALEQALAPWSQPATPQKPPKPSLDLAGAPPRRELTEIGRALAANKATMFRNIMVMTVAGKGCPQLKYFVDNAAQDGMEPLWRGWLSIAKHCDDGDIAARKLTRMHPYTEDRMQMKLSEIKGPYSCVAFDRANPGGCEGCLHRGQITNPLALGREIKTVDTADVPAPDAEEGSAARMQLPPPPAGFSYGPNGGVYFEKRGRGGDEETQILPLTTYYFFMTRMFRDGTDYLVEFTAIKGDKHITFAVPTSVLTSQAECVKTLASKNVMTTLGAMADPYLYQYVRGCMNNASATENTVNVPPRFGWQDDGRFAVGDVVYDSTSPTYNYRYVSDRMHNLIAATKTKGSVEDWSKVLHMLRAKAQKDTTLWGHLAFAGAGFGSVLMQFRPAGSRAATLHMCSKGSGIGKSLALSLVASVWGETERYSVAPSTSGTTMMQRSGLLGSLPLCVDEITSNSRAQDREWLPKFVFDYSMGFHKIKGSASGNVEIQHELHWAGISFLTSNAPGLEAMMGARKHTSEGEARRYLEWELPRSYQLQWTPEERTVLNNLRSNYGVAGREFVQWCVMNKDTVREVMLQVEGAWRQMSNATDEERFWTSTVVACVAGYILAGPKYANIVTVPVSPLLDFWLKLVRRARSIIDNNQQSALDVFNAYIRENNNNFVRVEGATVFGSVGGILVRPDTIRTVVRGRVEHDVYPGHTVFFVERKLLQLHCADCGMSFSSFIEELRGLVTVEECRRNLLAGTNGPSLNVACIKVTRENEACDADNLR